MAAHEGLMHARERAALREKVIPRCASRSVNELRPRAHLSHHDEGPQFDLRAPRKVQAEVKGCATGPSNRIDVRGTAAMRGGLRIRWTTAGPPGRFAQKYFLRQKLGLRKQDTGERRVAVPPLVF